MVFDFYGVSDGCFSDCFLVGVAGLVSGMAGVVAISFFFFCFSFFFFLNTVTNTVCLKHPILRKPPKRSLRLKIFYSL